MKRVAIEKIRPDVSWQIRKEESYLELDDLELARFSQGEVPAE